MNLPYLSNSNFGKIVLEEAAKKGFSPDPLITAPDKRMGRGMRRKPLPVKEFSEKIGARIKEVSNKEELHETIGAENPELVIVAGFGLIIPPETLSLSRFINIHPSLLPKYRGPTPIQSTILDGVRETGVSIFLMNEQIDAGPIIAQRKIILPEKVDYKEAEEILAREGGVLLVETLPRFEQLEANEQEEKEATYTKILQKEDGLIDWNDSAENIERKIRAFRVWPGAYSHMNGKVMKILEAEVQEQTEHGPFGDPGKIYLGTNDSIAVQTGKNFLLIKKLQIEGKDPIPSKEFLQGNMASIGSFLS